MFPTVGNFKPLTVSGSLLLTIVLFTHKRIELNNRTHKRINTHSIGHLCTRLRSLPVPVRSGSASAFPIELYLVAGSDLTVRLQESCKERKRNNESYETVSAIKACRTTSNNKATWKGTIPNSLFIAKKTFNKYPRSMRMQLSDFEASSHGIIIIS